MFRKIVHVVLTLLLLVFLIFTCNTSKHPPDFASFQNPELGKNGQKVWLTQSNALSVGATRQILDNEVYYRNLFVLANSDTILTDTATLYFTNYGLLPIVRALGNGKTEVLMGFVSDADYNVDMLQWIFNRRQLLFSDTLPLFDGNHTDTDDDGIVEFSGFRGGISPYCFNCDSDYYRPKLFYELAPDGMKLDSSSTKDWAIKTYGAFYGFKTDTGKIVPLLPEKNNF
ncbi:hypothetical protein C7N43_01265 [Sphingobacteriales bacterium UPWRP_1]|nr:hypothetical protein B6N25_14650 [Sphingobacteriales bacterium TSM_CSS]PSJ78939.1 hypothetical protein C7N43_01265 [Sphingobacteriales bacterium UPWRP_1]